jgi:hypothetical protein
MTTLEKTLIATGILALFSIAYELSKVWHNLEALRLTLNP